MRNEQAFSGQGSRRHDRRNVSFLLTHAQVLGLDRLAAERDVSRAWLVRLAVAQFLARETKPGPDS